MATLYGGGLVASSYDGGGEGFDCSEISFESIESIPKSKVGKSKKRGFLLQESTLFFPL